METITINTIKIFLELSFLQKVEILLIQTILKTPRKIKKKQNEYNICIKHYII